MRNTKRGEIYQSETINDNGLPKFTSTYYPINFTTSNRYVFFSSLFDKPVRSTGYNLAQKAVTVLYGPMRNPVTNFRGKQNERLTAALDFLKNAAALEYAREQQFISFYTKNNPELAKTLQSLPNSGQSKYFDLITKLNLLIKGYDQYKAALAEEISRINRNKEIDRLDAAANRAGRSVNATDPKKKLTSEEYQKRKMLDNDDGFGNSARNPYFKLNGETIFKSLFSERSNFSIIAREIIITYGAKLFELKNSHLHLNNRQLDILLKILIQKAYEILIFNLKDEINKKQGETRTQRRARIQARLHALLLEKREFNDFLNSIVNAPNINSSLDAIADQYGIPQYPEIQQEALLNKTAINPLKQRLHKVWQDERRKWVEAGNDIKKFDKFNTWRDKRGASDIDLEEMMYATQKIQAQAYYTNENMALTDLLALGLPATLGGGKNTTDDIEAGAIIFKFTDVASGMNAQLMSETEDEMWQIQNDAYNKLTLITDLDSFQANTRELRDARKRQEIILNNLKKKIDADSNATIELLSHINIHDTVKGYASIDAKSARFHGAAFGATIFDQIDIITSMAEEGGISIADRDWLILAAMNCGKGMIGRGNKNKLENYLSAFVGLLMFNDAALIVEDIKKFMQDQYTFNGVQDIHLYTLNTFYVPSSYILNATYERLSALVNQITLSADNATHLELDTYNPAQTSGFSPEELEFPEARRWNIERRNAETETKLTMTFLGGFLDLLDDLEKAVTK